jgi:hypothetical protein
VLKDIKQGALLSGEAPGAGVGEGSGAVGRYMASGSAPPLLRKVLAEEQANEAFDAARELREIASKSDPKLAKSLRDEADRIIKWNNRQMKLAERAKKADGPAIVGTGSTPDQLGHTMLHETIHSAQTAGAPIVRPFQTQLGTKEYPDWKPKLEMALEQAGYDPKWAKQLIEQEAWLLEHMGKGSGGGVGTFGRRHAEELPALYETSAGLPDIITHEQTEELQRLLKLKPGSFGALE